MSKPALLLRAARRLVLLSAPERRLTLEAIGLLLLARLALTFVRFERIGRWASRETRGCPPRGTGEREALCDAVRLAVTRSARHVPWKAVCFDQGLAAQHMLRRRGVASALYLGVEKQPGGGLGAHVWVKDGATDIVGGAIAERFTTLIHFPTD